MTLDCVRHVRVWRDGALAGEYAEADDLMTALHDPQSLVWVDLVAPGEEDVRWLAAEIGMATGTVEDLTAPLERPKVTRYPTHLFFQAYATSVGTSSRSIATESGGGLVLSRISGFVLPHALITVRPDESFDIAEVVRRWTDNYDLVSHGPGALVHGLFDTIVDGHFETIQLLDDDIEQLEDVLFEERQTNRDFQRTVYGLRKDLVKLRRVVLPMREVVNGLMRHRPSGSPDLDSEYDDLYDHVLRAAEWTESLRDMITSLFETNLSLQDARLNTVMKKLAAWAAIVAVPTAITGWFGQNVPYPGFSAGWGVWFSLVLIVALSTGLYVAFRRLGWL